MGLTSWNNFVQLYINKQVGEVTKDPHEDATSQDFIGVINEEYKRRKEKAPECSYITQGPSPYKQKFATAFPASNQPVILTSKQLLEDQFQTRQCTHCGHLVEKCWQFKPQCSYCGLFGHEEKVCC